MDKYFLADPFTELWTEPPERYPYDLSVHPTAQCTKALSAYNRWKATGAEEAKQKFIEGADWLVENQNPMGAWEFPFDYKVPGYDAKAPWVCCMTQGMGVSVLTRAKRLDALHRALDVLRSNGLRTDHGHYLWYEGIPSKPRGTVILNEHLFALIGKVEAVGGLPTIDLVSLDEDMKQFDLDLPFFKWSRYDNGLYFYAPPKYHWVQVKQLRWLAEKTGSTVCREYASKWERWWLDYRESPGMYLFIRFWRWYLKWLDWRHR